MIQPLLVNSYTSSDMVPELSTEQGSGFKDKLSVMVVYYQSVHHPLITKEVTKTRSSTNIRLDPLGCEFPIGEDWGTTGFAKHIAYTGYMTSLLWAQEEPVHRTLALTFNICAILWSRCELFIQKLD